MRVMRQGYIQSERPVVNHSLAGQSVCSNWSKHLQWLVLVKMCGVTADRTDCLVNSGQS